MKFVKAAPATSPQKAALDTLFGVGNGLPLTGVSISVDVSANELTHASLSFDMIVDNVDAIKAVQSWISEQIAKSPNIKKS